MNQRVRSKSRQPYEPNDTTANRLFIAEFASASFCLNSGREIVTHIDTDQATLNNMRNMKLSLWCSHCGRSHQVLGSEAYVNEQPTFFETARLAVTANESVSDVMNARSMLANQPPLLQSDDQCRGCANSRFPICIGMEERMCRGHLRTAPPLADWREGCPRQ